MKLSWLEPLAEVEVDGIRHAHGPLAAHYLLAVFHGQWLAGAAQAASDSRASRFWPLAEIDTLPMTDGARAFIHRAVALQR